MYVSIYLAQESSIQGLRWGIYVEPNAPGFCKVIRSLSRRYNSLNLRTLNLLLRNPASEKPGELGSLDMLR